LGVVNNLDQSSDMQNIQVIFEDNHLIAVNKPGGVLVQGDETGDMPLSDWVKQYIKIRYEKPGDVFLGTIHRLDRPASGVVIFARTSKALSRMNELFKKREIEKTYWAITNKRPYPLSATLEHYLEKDTRKNFVHAYNQSRGNAKKATLDYELIGELGEHHLLKVNLHTGRPHQIRVQLAKIGCTIRGDVKYGYDRTNRRGTIYLHCRKMEFVHPVRKEPVSIEAPVPDDQIWNLFEQFK